MEIVPYCETEGERRIACAQAGRADCLETIMCENEGLIQFVIRMQWIGQADWADMVQVGRIGLWHAVRNYDPQRGVRFSTYARQAIRHRVWQEVERTSRLAGMLEAPEYREQLDELVGSWQNAQIRAALDEGLEQLSERQRQVVELYYGWDGSAPHKFWEIGQLLGLSGEWVRKIHHSALLLLRAPALSIRLRSICARGSRGNYRQALGQNQAWQRKYRGRGCKRPGFPLCRCSPG